MKHALLHRPDLSSDAGSYSPLPRIPVRSPLTVSPCTGAEIDTLVRLLRTMRPRPVSVVIGTAADAVSRANAVCIGEAWADHQSFDQSGRDGGNSRPAEEDIRRTG
jgi:hypothetical protein